MPQINKIIYKIHTILSTVIILFLFPAESVALTNEGNDNDITAEFIRQIENNLYDELLVRRIELQQATTLERLAEDFTLRGFDVLNDTISIFTIFDHDQSYLLSMSQKREAVSEVYTAAKKLKNKRLELLSDFFRGKYHTITDYERKMELLEDVARKARRRNDTEMEALALREMWHDSYFTQRNHQSFVYARRLADALGHVNDAYPLKSIGYIWLGIAYYHFKDDEQGYNYLHKGLSYRKDANLLFTSGQYLRAWDYLASYHQTHGNLDSAAYYNRLKIITPEAAVGSRPHLPIAISKLGKIEMQIGNEAVGTQMMETALRYMQNDAADGEFKAGVHAILAEYYLSQGDAAAARSHLDNSYSLVGEFYDIDYAHRLKDIYAAESKYYAFIGQPTEAFRYVDSVRVMASRYERISGQHIILLAEQEFQQAETELHKERISRQKMIIIFAAVLLCLALITVLVFVRLFQLKRRAYRTLATRAREWADSGVALRGSNLYGGNTDIKPVAPGTGQEHISCEEVKALAEKLETYMVNHKPYTDPELTLEGLAKTLGVTRNKLSAVINSTSNKSFKLYINDLRIMEALHLMNTNPPGLLSMDQLLEQCGFNGRTTYYTSFKTITGLTPAQYWKNIAKDENNN